MKSESLENLRPKAKAFMQELDALCKRYRVQIAVSGYDGIELWPMKDGDEAVYAAGIEDMLPEDEIVPDPFMGLSQRVRNCLAAAGIKTFVDVHQAFDGGRAYALLRLPNFGRGCLNEVRRWIEKELEDRRNG